LETIKLPERLVSLRMTGRQQAAARHLAESHQAVADGRGGPVSDAFALPEMITVVSTAHLAANGWHTTALGECKSNTGSWSADLCHPQRPRWLAALNKALKAMQQSCSYSLELNKMVPYTIKQFDSSVALHLLIDFGPKADGTPLTQLGSMGCLDDANRSAPDREHLLDFSPPMQNAQVADGLKPLAEFVRACCERARKESPDTDRENHLRDAAVQVFLEYKHLLDELYEGVEFQVSKETKLVSGRFDMLLWTKFTNLKLR